MITEEPLVTVITATTGNPLFFGCLNSVQKQTYPNIQHLVVADGPERFVAVQKQIEKIKKKEGYRLDVLKLPYSIGKDRWNGHRIYAAGTYMADGDYVMFLDDDNYIDVDHVDLCIKKIKEGNDWTYSFRKIVDKNHDYICDDNCESLGKWASVLHPADYFIDVNCYFLPKLLAVQISPVWYRKFREPGQPEIDRVISHVLRSNFPKFDSTYAYSVNYTSGNSQFSVQTDFFRQGNAEMLKRYNGVLPWKK
jgi:glycosyltransferase involved in cell wall biosynthesis